MCHVSIHQRHRRHHGHRDHRGSYYGGICDVSAGACHCGRFECYYAYERDGYWCKHKNIYSSIHHSLHIHAWYECVRAVTVWSAAGS